MPSSSSNYLLNLTKLARGDRTLRPLVVTYYATTQCNLNCAYCEYFGARRNALAEEQLDLDQARRVLRVIRTGIDRLIVTGGEPLLHPEIDALLLSAKHDLHFKHLTLLTNASLLDQHEAMLLAVDRLVISLDSTDADVWQQIIRAAPGTAHAILGNIQTYAARQREFGYALVVNCVLTPHTVTSAQAILDFCVEHNILVSFSPQAVNNWPHYDLLVSNDYRVFVQHLIDRKQAGAPILGSLAYLRTLLDFQPYACYPLLVPRVMPNGDLVYPCRPIEQGHVERGGRPCNLLEVDSWNAALKIALDEYGQPPQTCTSCFQQCFAETSLLQAKPLSLLRELTFPASRRGSVWTHAPG
jgi:MoaA/NifB/PqqE/SkfB family radical SAM enzyme